jgi:hypothetical protein
MWKDSARNNAPRRSRRELNQEIHSGVPQASPHWSLFRVPNEGIISANSRGSEMLARRHPRGTAGRAVSVAPKRFARTLILYISHILGAVGLNFAAQGCPYQKSTDRPSLELAEIPSAARGGPERIDTIAGRVRNAYPRQQSIVQAQSGPWWVQPGSTCPGS